MYNCEYIAGIFSGLQYYRWPLSQVYDTILSDKTELEAMKK